MATVFNTYTFLCILDDFQTILRNTEQKTTINEGFQAQI